MSSLNNQLTIQVIGGDGKVIFTGKFYPNNNNFEIQFDLSNLNPVIYFVRLQNVRDQMIVVGEEVVGRSLM